MTNLKRSFFGAAIYLAVIFVLGQADNAGRPIINFANYFYVAIMAAMPLTLFIPFISRLSVFVSLGVWASIYAVLLLTLERRMSASPQDFSVIALEFILLVIGVWLAHHMAVGCSGELFSLWSTDKFSFYSFGIHYVPCVSIYYPLRTLLCLVIYN